MGHTDGKRLSSTPENGRRLRAGLRLLLTRGDSEQPQVVLPHGLPTQALDGAPAPTTVPQAGGSLAYGDSSRDASLLSERRWGVVVPAAEPLRGQLLSAVQPLLSLRAEQQGLDLASLLRTLVYPAPSDPELPMARAVDWYRRAIREEDLSEELRKNELERPDYLLVLGDLHQVPESIAQVLASYGHFVGRLAFTETDGQPRLADYRRYAEKIAAAADCTGRLPAGSDEEGDEESESDARERGRPGAPPSRRARLLYVRDGSEATELADELLIRPLLLRLSQPGKKGRPQDLNSAQTAALTRSDELLAAAAQLPASLLFTVGHGYGGPRAGFASPAEQRRLQGALSFPSPSLHGAAASRRLSAEDLRAAGVPFVAGGVWFMLACYGAGTPAESQFYHWLAARSGKLDDEARWVLRSLPAPAQRVPGSRPFIASLPQAVLAQPDGPLAIIGHLDLAWSYSFSDAGEGDDSGGDSELGRADYDHFETFVRSLLRKTRLGPAFASLTSKRRSAEQSLLRRYDSQRRSLLRAESAPGAAGPPTDPALRRHWMTRQDLIGYVLLGDPAARLSPSVPRDSPQRPVTTIEASAAAGEASAGPAPQAAAAGPSERAAGGTRPQAQALDDVADASDPSDLPAGLDPQALEEAIVRSTLAPTEEGALAATLGLRGSQLRALSGCYHRAGRDAIENSVGNALGSAPGSPRGER
jgi:hypothetical protein